MKKISFLKKENLLYSLISSQNGKKNIFLNERKKCIVFVDIKSKCEPGIESEMNSEIISICVWYEIEMFFIPAERCLTTSPSEQQIPDAAAALEIMSNSRCLYSSLARSWVFCLQLWAEEHNFLPPESPGELMFLCDTGEKFCSELPGKAVNEDEQECWQVLDLFPIILLATDAHILRNKDGWPPGKRQAGPSVTFNSSQENLLKHIILHFYLFFQAVTPHFMVTSEAEWRLK